MATSALAFLKQVGLSVSACPGSSRPPAHALLPHALPFHTCLAGFPRLREINCNTRADMSIIPAVLKPAQPTVSNDVYQINLDMNLANYVNRCFNVELKLTLCPTVRKAEVRVVRRLSTSTGRRLAA